MILVGVDAFMGMILNKAVARNPVVVSIMSISSSNLMPLSSRAWDTASFTASRSASFSCGSSRVKSRSSEKR